MKKEKTESVSQMENLAIQLSSEITKTKENYTKLLKIKNELNDIQTSSDDEEVYRKYLIEKCESVMKYFQNS
jgi:chaperonin cofactor prefoldin